MEYRRATSGDIDAFVKNRMEFVMLIRKIADIESFENDTRKYLIDNIDSDKLIVFIAIEGSDIIASCMACIFETAPLPSCLNGKIAELLNVYTKECHRNAGHSKRLLEMTIEELKKAGVEKIILEYTEEGRLLYEKLGFSVQENQMQLKLV